jgi:hypothetical protein
LGASHGGEIKVEAKGGEGLPAEASAKAGSEFIIQLAFDLRIKVIL